MHPCHLFLQRLGCVLRLLLVDIIFFVFINIIFSARRIRTRRTTIRSVTLCSHAIVLIVWYAVLETRVVLLVGNAKATIAFVDGYSSFLFRYVADVKHFLIAFGFFLLTIQVSGYHHRIVDSVCNGKADGEYQKWTHIILCFIDDLYSMQWQKCQLRVQSKE